MTLSWVTTLSLAPLKRACVAFDWKGGLCNPIARRDVAGGAWGWGAWGWMLAENVPTNCVSEGGAADSTM